MHEYEDDEAYELRLARRQWLDPERKEKIMGKKPISQQFTSNNTLNDLLNELFEK